jgi:hypothetical protein
MKKVFGMSVILVAFLAVMPLVAQDMRAQPSRQTHLVPNEEQRAPLYYLTVHVERVFPHKRGYVIDYRTGFTGTRTERLYIPREWFEDASRVESGEAPKAELFLQDRGNAWPYLTVFYRDGEFSHVRVHLRRDRSHPSWGGIPSGTNLDSRFDGVEAIELMFGEAQ